MKIIMFFPLLLLVCSVSADETETAGQQSCPQDIHAVLRELTASLAVQTERITVLQRENQGTRQKIQTDKLTQQLQGTVRESENINRKTDIYVIRVATCKSNSKTETTLVFKHVVTNTGNAYNKHTGIFTAPVRGVYHFVWTVLAHVDGVAAAVLIRNGEHIFLAHGSQGSGTVSGSHGASLLLEVGDQVFVRLCDGSKIYDNENHHTTFSGHLIFTM
uniref:C1q domain-containing protein n=1 Tax=Maylandia zebra TaxID=106582 RepID=A0A3P9DEV5_9CICH